MLDPIWNRNNKPTHIHSRVGCTLYCMYAVWLRGCEICCALVYNHRESVVWEKSPLIPPKYSNMIFFRGILNELINCVVLSEMFILFHDIRDYVGEHRAEEIFLSVLVARYNHGNVKWWREGWYANVAEISMPVCSVFSTPINSFELLGVHQSSSGGFLFWFSP